MDITLELNVQHISSLWFTMVNPVSIFSIGKLYQLWWLIHAQDTFKKYSPLYCCIPLYIAANPSQHLLFLFGTMGLGVPQRSPVLCTKVGSTRGSIPKGMTQRLDIVIQKQVKVTPMLTCVLELSGCCIWHSFTIFGNFL